MTAREPRAWPRYDAGQYDPLMLLRAHLAEMGSPPPRLRLADRPASGMTWDAFAYREDGRRGSRYSTVGPRPYVALHGLGWPIVPVVVTETAYGDPDATHWGWIAVGEDTPTWALVWPSRAQYAICFPYGVKAEEERGRGRTVRLRVAEPGGVGTINDNNQKAGT
jgi:hypothetical protein